LRLCWIFHDLPACRLRRPFEVHTVSPDGRQPAMKVRSGPAQVPRDGTDRGPHSASWNWSVVEPYVDGSVVLIRLIER
jgi:hypothetical protein